MSTPMPAMIIRLPRNRSNSESPSTLPRCPSERPAPKNTASGPAMAKKRMVATKLMKVDVTATGSGTPYRRMVYIVMGPRPELSGVM